MLCFVLITPAPMSNSLVEITHYMCEGFTVALLHFMGFLGYDTNVLGEYFYFRGMYSPPPDFTVGVYNTQNMKPLFAFNNYKFKCPNWIIRNLLHCYNDKYFIFVVPCFVILGWRNPTRCNSMQIFIYCLITLHVLGILRTHHQEYIKV